MEKNPTGYFMYQNIHTTQQVNNIKEFFEFLLKEEQFDIIIELGTSFGGLTYILNDICVDNSLHKNIHTFDFSYKEYVEKFLNEKNISYHILDERESEYKELVINLLTNSKKALLLCDGGNKKEEFNRYSEYLKKGDIIMAHDYSINNDIFESEIKNKIWNWLEISYLDIEESVNKNNLESYKKLDFKNAVWACFQKN